MGSYPISVRLWALFTAAFCLGLVAWTHWLDPRNSLWTDAVKAVTGHGPTRRWLLDCALLGVSFFGLIGIAGVVSYAILAPATQLARRLTPPPSSPQDADYDDGTDAPPAA
jgi:hypothetical protein